MEKGYNVSSGFHNAVATYFGKNLDSEALQKIIGLISAESQPIIETMYMAFLKQKPDTCTLKDVFSLLNEKGFVTETMESETEKYALGEFLENEKLDFDTSRYLRHFKILNIDNKKIRKAMVNLVNRVYESVDYKDIVRFCKSAKVSSGKLSNEVKGKLRTKARNGMKNNLSNDLDDSIETLQFLGVSDSIIGILARHDGDNAILESGDAYFAKDAYGKTHALGEKLGKERVRLLNHNKYPLLKKIGREIKSSL